MNHRLTVTAAVATVLASVALYSLISRTGWFWAGIGAVIVTAAVGTLTRLRPLPVIVCYVAVLAGLLLYVNLLFAGPQSFLGLIPTPASAHHLFVLAQRANSQMANYAPPVPATHGILVLSTAGIGIVAATTDLIAVRLRRPAIAGLPLLVLFCVPLTTTVKPGWVGDVVVFSLGITGYLALLSAEGRERVRLWGRLVNTWPGRSEAKGPDTRQLTAAGRRIGFATVVLALCVPLILPGLQHHRIFPGHTVGTGGGTGGPLSLPQPLVQMNEQLHMTHPEPILTYHTASSAPPYLQVYVLSTLGKTAWSLAQPSASAEIGSGTLPAVPGLASTTRALTVHETITLAPAMRGGRHQLNYIPVPYAPRSMDVTGDWRVDKNSLSVFTASTPLAGLHYSVTSRDIDPAPQQLRQARAPSPSEQTYLIVPPQYQRLLPLTKRITARQNDAYSKAVALQEWFTQAERFTYSLDVPQPQGAAGLYNFLTKSRRGYCQQFAFAMAVMARLLGIPSRVVVGYTQGIPQGDDRWLVKTSDAHAWPELYFKGAGWLRFEPTPISSSEQNGQATASAPAYSVPPLSGVGPSPQPSASTPTQGAQPKTTPSRGRLGPPIKELGGSNGRGGGTSGALPVALVVVAVLAAAAAAPRAARSITRRRRWFKAADDAGRAHAAWLEFRDDLTDHRIACRASETPRALARRVSASLGFAAAERDAAQRIARAEERARYATTPAASAQLRGDVTTVRRALAKACRLPARYVAMALPASALAPVRTALTNALDVFGWMDVITSGLHQRREQATRSWRA
jgi:TgpA N-terminal domain/Transglutaminase-like superfamily